MRALTISLWVRVTQSMGTLDKPLFKGAATPPAPGYAYEFGADEWHVDVGDGVAECGAVWGWENEFVGEWPQLVVVIDRGRGVLSAFTNGVLCAEEGIPNIGSITSILPLMFSASSWRFRGLLDEVRLVRTARSADWIAAEYANLSAPESIPSIGPEQQAP
jgi:hypothetical protein